VTVTVTVTLFKRHILEKQQHFLRPYADQDTALSVLSHLLEANGDIFVFGMCPFGQILA
jgi:hypothetical protein